MPPIDTATKKAIAGLLIGSLVGFGALVGSCIGGRPPTEAQVRDAEDRFCNAIANIRAAETALESDASAGGSK